jgi:hypothetical protein
LLHAYYTLTIVTLGKALQHLFIPHKHNKYAPHIFREFSIGAMVISIFFLLGVSFGSSFILKKTVLGANVTADILVDLTNETRVAHDDAPLVRNATLDKAATLKGDDMSSYGYFSHNSPTGVTPWHWFQEAGYNFLYAGENLAINFIDATEVRDAWLASPTHRANLLDTRFKEIGMATISGIYQGEPTIYVVQLFGTPAKASAQPPKAAAPVASLATSTPLAVAPSTSSTGTVALAPGSVEGVSRVNGTTTEAPKLKPVITTNQLAVVENTEAVPLEAQPAPEKVQTYAPWYEHALFGSTYYVDRILKGLFAFIFVSLVLLLGIELRRQHWKHAVYGMSVLVILLLAIILNQLFW